MRVAAVQFAAGEDKAANRDRVVDLVGQAADAGATLVVAPEAAMLDFGPPERPVSALAEPLDGEFVGALRRIAIERRVTVVAGMFETASGPRLPFNTVVAVGPQGDLLAVYRKQHLFDALGWQESAKLTPGAPAGVVFTCEDLTVGLLTCYDLRFPELTRVLVDGGATLLAVPSAWVSGEHKVEQWLTLTSARAIENVCYVVASDQTGPTYAGHSRVIDPFGIPLAAASDGDAVVVTEVSAERVAACRSRMPSLDHRRWSVVPRR